MKTLLIRLSSFLSLQRAFSPPRRHSVTTILYHRFFVPGEDLEAGRSRLRRQCEWVRRTYTPVASADMLDHLLRGTLPAFPLLVTVDDASTDVLDAYPVFEEFEIPVTLFVVVGWTDNTEPTGDITTLSRIVDFVHFYSGPDRTIQCEVGFPIVLGSQSRATMIDRILGHPGREEPEFQERVWTHLKPLRSPVSPRRRCTWPEIRDLSRRGVEIGSHTVTHCCLSRVSPRRLDFELCESRRAIISKLNSCSLFAYPYGTRDVYNQRTTEAVAAAGYAGAFLTHPGFAEGADEAFTLPRIVIPDHSVDQRLFRALVKGGSLPLARVREILSRHVAGVHSGHS